MLRRGQARLAAEASGGDRFEALGLDFARRVRAGFLTQAAAPLAEAQAAVVRAVHAMIAAREGKVFFS